MLMHGMCLEMLHKLAGDVLSWQCVAVSEGSRRCHRTLKYFQAVAHKLWVLSVDWARDCVTQSQLLAPVCSLTYSSVHFTVELMLNIFRSLVISALQYPSNTIFWKFSAVFSLLLILSWSIFDQHCDDWWTFICFLSCKCPEWGRGTLPSFSHPCAFTSPSFVLFFTFPIFLFFFFFALSIFFFRPSRRLFYQSSPTPFPGRRL